MLFIFKHLEQPHKSHTQQANLIKMSKLPITGIYGSSSSRVLPPYLVSSVLGIYHSFLLPSRLAKQFKTNIRRPRGAAQTVATVTSRLFGTVVY